MKQKTNDQMLIELIKTNSPILNAILRERIVVMMNATVKSMNEDPERWNQAIVHPGLYRELNDNVNKVIGFNN
jgi:hypothetical protein